MMGEQVPEASEQGGGSILHLPLHQASTQADAEVILVVKHDPILFAFVVIHVVGYHRHASELPMPRACLVVIHVIGYQRQASELLKPRACLVVIHLVGYRSHQRGTTQDFSCGIFSARLVPGSK